MSKSLGNFFTLRDLFARGHRPSAIRYLLASVPYRRQLNFTFAGLQQAASSVERLRNFRLRLRTEKFPPGESGAPEHARQAMEEFAAALDDDLNTAEALAAVFNLVRDTNAAMDCGEFRAGDVPALEDALARFDAGFAVLEERMDAGYGAAAEITDAEVEALLAERQKARARRDFARADQIRQELAEKGIVVEDTKDGARWKRG
jgi:cysteinyl-tRNA synthetase